MHIDCLCIYAQWLPYFFQCGTIFSLVYRGDVVHFRASDWFEEGTFNLSPSLSPK